TADAISASDVDAPRSAMSVQAASRISARVRSDFPAFDMRCILIYFTYVKLLETLMKANPENDNANDNAKESLRIDRLIAAYGEGEGAPGRAQWQALLALPEASPVTLLNFFKLRPR